MVVTESQYSICFLGKNILLNYHICGSDTIINPSLSWSPVYEQHTVLEKKKARVFENAFAWILVLTTSCLFRRKEKELMKRTFPSMGVSFSITFPYSYLWRDKDSCYEHWQHFEMVTLETFIKRFPFLPYTIFWNIPYVNFFPFVKN